MDQLQIVVRSCTSTSIVVQVLPQSVVTNIASADPTSIRNRASSTIFWHFYLDILLLLLTTICNWSILEVVQLLIQKASIIIIRRIFYVFNISNCHRCSM